MSTETKSIDLESVIADMAGSLEDVKLFISPVVVELKEFQHNSETVEALKTRNGNIKESVTSYIEKGVAKFKTEKISNKMIINFLFMTLKAELSVDTKDYTKAVINVLEWYYSNANILIKKEAVSFDVLRKLKNLKAYYSNKAIKGLMTDKSLITADMYKVALNGILSGANDLKLRFGTLHMYSEAQLKTVTDGTKLITYKSETKKITFNGAFIGDKDEIAKFKNLVALPIK